MLTDPESPGPGALLQSAFINPFLTSVLPSGGQGRGLEKLRPEGLLRAELAMGRCVCLWLSTTGAARACWLLVGFLGD